MPSCCISNLWLHWKSTIPLENRPITICMPSILTIHHGLCVDWMSSMLSLPCCRQLQCILILCITLNVLLKTLKCFHCMPPTAGHTMYWMGCPWCFHCMRSISLQTMHCIRCPYKVTKMLLRVVKYITSSRQLHFISCIALNTLLMALEYI